MDNRKLNACESSVASRKQGVVEKDVFSRILRSKTRALVSPELLCFIHQRLPSVHGLHAKDLVVALLVVKHARRKIVKDVLIGQRPVSLGRKCEQPDGWVMRRGAPVSTRAI